jgi:hypothetical protein
LRGGWLREAGFAVGRKLKVEIKDGRQSLNVAQRVVNAVKADPEEGDDELYVARGYVRNRDRKMGLTRRKPEVSTP